MEKFNNSIGYDQIMWQEDIKGSIAYADALGRCSILEQNEVDSIKDGLKQVKEEWANGTFELKPSDEVTDAWSEYITTIILVVY